MIFHVALANAFPAEADARAELEQADGIDPGTYRGIWRMPPPRDDVAVHLFGGPEPERFRADGWLPVDAGFHVKQRCRNMETRRCPSLGCTDLPCARFEDDDEGRWAGTFTTERQG